MKLRKAGKAFLKHLPYIETIIFTTDSYFSGQKTTTVHFQDDQAIYLTEHRFARDGRAAIPQPGMSKTKFFEEIRALHIEEWEKEYLDDTVLDGMQWNLTFYFADGHKPVKISGSNAYPPHFDGLRQLMTFPEPDAAL